MTIHQGDRLRHLPGYIDSAAKLRAAGLEAIGAFTRAIGVVIDLPAFGLSGRFERYSMVGDDGVVTKLVVEKSALDHEGSSAVCMLAG